MDSQFDSLPYIDDEPSEVEVQQARNLITKEIERGYESRLHPSIPKYETSWLTPVLKETLDEIESGEKSTGIDLSKYTQLYDKDGRLDIQRAYVALAYNELRNESLLLLSEHGKNQWLVGNDQLDQNVKLLSTELRNQQRGLESINQTRQAQQQNAKGALDYLDNKWRDSIKTLVDVNIACASLQNEINELRGD